MKPITRVRPPPRENQPRQVQPLNARFITLYGDDLNSHTKSLIGKLLQGRQLRPQVIDASALTAEQAVMQVTAELSKKNGHLLICAHGQNAKINDDEVHYIGLPQDGRPYIATESLVRMVVDQLGIEPSRVDQPGKSLPFIYFLSCHSGALRRQISPASELWKRANLLMFAGTHYTNVLSSSNSMAGAIAYIDLCQRTLQEVDPLKLFFFAGMHRGDCITLMGGKLSAPLVWHAPKSGKDQGRIDNLSGSPEDKQRFEAAVASLRPAEYRLLPAASLTEILCNRITRDDADRVRDLLVAHPELRHVPTHSGVSPLGFAAESQASRCLLALLDAGADPNARDAHGDTALMAAVRFPTVQLGNVKMLLGHGADPNMRDLKGRTTLMFACVEGHTEAVQVLLAHGANPAFFRDDGETAMSLACRNGHEGVVKCLLAQGVDPNRQYTGKRTALMAACIHGHIEVASLLLGSGAKLDLRDEQGMTALMWSVGQTELSSLRLLLDQGADPDVRSNAGFTALMYAVSLADLTPLQLLLAANANPNVQDNHGDTALIQACLLGNTAAMQTLLDAGADPDLQNKQGVTALMAAVDQPGTAAVQLLLEQGARIDVFASDGSSSLTRAAMKNRPDILRLLFAFGAGPSFGLNQQLIDNASALGHHDVARMLQIALEHFNGTQ